MFQRPAFRAGTINLNIPDSSVSKIFNKRKLGKDADLVGIRSISTTAAAPVIGRKVPNFTRLKEIELETKGQLVRFGPDTLNKILSVKVPDERNPNILVEKNVSISQLLQTSIGRMVGLQSSLNSLTSQTNKESQLSKNLQQQLILFIITALDRHEQLSQKEFDTVIKSLSKIDMSPNPLKAGIKNQFIDDAVFSRNRGLILAFLMAPQNIPRGLSVDKPVRNIVGQPIDIEELEEDLDNGQILDIRTRKVFLTRRAADEEEKEQFIPREPFAFKSDFPSISAPSFASSFIESEEEETGVPIQRLPKREKRGKFRKSPGFVKRRSLQIERSKELPFSPQGVFIEEKKKKKVKKISKSRSTSRSSSRSRKKGRKKKPEKRRRK